MTSGALAMGGGDGGIYDAAMRLVELSADPKKRKAKLDELRAATAAAGKAMDEVKQAKADLSRREEVLADGQKELAGRVKGVAKLEKTVSLKKVQFDNEAVATNEAQDKERRRLADQAKALDDKAESLGVEAAFVQKEAAGAVKMKAQAVKRMGVADEMIRALRAIVCK